MFKYTILTYNKSLWGCCINKMEVIVQAGNGYTATKKARQITDSEYAEITKIEEL